MLIYTFSGKVIAEPNPAYLLQDLGRNLTYRDVPRMVDKAYKKDLPQLRSDLEKLRDGFSSLGSSRTNWTKLRIEPLLKHLDSLEQLLNSEEFSRESSRLTKGVRMFHSDLVYLRENIKGLEKVLLSEKKSLKKRDLK